MVAGLHQMDVTANNLANASTPGYRSSDTIQQPFHACSFSGWKVMGRPAGMVQRANIGRLGIGALPWMGLTPVSPSEALRQTDNPLDAALLEPDVFFTIATDDWLSAILRNGSFQLTARRVNWWIKAGNPCAGDPGVPFILEVLR